MNTEESGGSAAELSASEVVAFFDSRAGKPSGRLYQKLSSDPVIAELTRRKKLTYREMLLVVSTVVAALDDRLEGFEVQFRRWNLLSSVVNAPMLALGDSSRPRSNNGGDDSNPPSDEIAWFGRHLTLRNVGAVLVIILTMSTGFFAWWNQDYRSLLDASKERVSRLQEEKQDLRAKLLAAETAQQNDARALAELKPRLAAAEDKLEIKSQELVLARDAKASKLEMAQEGQAAQIDELKVALAAVQKDAKTSTDSANSWKNLYDQQSGLLQEKSSSVNRLEGEKEAASIELEKVVNAWNSLLEFLGRNRTGQLVSVKRTDLEEKLQMLERYTLEVRGMRRALP